MQVGSGNESSQVRGCYNITVLQPTTKQCRLVIYCEATHVCYIENAREVTHVILMLLVDQG